MKKIKLGLVVGVLILLNTINGFAQQYVNFGSTTKEIQNIAKNDIYVITVGNKAFDNALVSAVQKNWKLSKSVKTIKSGDVEDYLKNENNYFIAPVDLFNGLANTMELLNSKSLEPQSNVTHLQDKNLVFFNGKPSKIAKFNFRTVITSVPFIINNLDNYAPMLEYMVNGINSGVDAVIKNNMIGKAVEQGVYTESRKNAAILKNKTLIIQSGFFLKTEDLKKYKAKYELKTGSEINKLLTDGSTAYCIFSYSINNTAGCKSVYVYDLETKSIIYAMYTQDALEPNGEDLIRMNNAMNGK